MDFKIELSDNKNSYIIKNLFPLYFYDVSQFEQNLPNIHGIIGGFEDTKSISQLCYLQDEWWKHPKSLFPYVITVNNIPAGFSIVATHPYIPVPNIDFIIHEFFLLSCFRGKNIGELAAIECFNKYHGNWEIVTYPTQEAAKNFWRKVLKKYTNNKYTENEGEHPWGQKVIFNFKN